MKAAFESYLRQQTQLDEAGVRRVSSLAISRKLRRNEFLLRERVAAYLQCYPGW